MVHLFISSLLRGIYQFSRYSSIQHPSVKFFFPFIKLKPQRAPLRRWPTGTTSASLAAAPPWACRPNGSPRAKAARGCTSKRRCWGSCTAPSGWRRRGERKLVRCGTGRNLKVLTFLRCCEHLEVRFLSSLRDVRQQKRCNKPWMKLDIS